MLRIYIYIKPHTQATRDILLVADAWAVDLSPLEMQNAFTKRTASSCGSRRLEMSGTGEAVVPMKSGKLGPERLVQTKGYSTTMAVSTMKHLLVARELHQGDGPFKLPPARRTERLFGSLGRTSTYRASRVKHLKPADGYVPSEDTCIKAFVRLIAAAATEARGAQTPSDGAA